MFMAIFDEISCSLLLFASMMCSRCGYLDVLFSRFHHVSILLLTFALADYDLRISVVLDNNLSCLFSFYSDYADGLGSEFAWDF
jgi:hypothetical protein